jgi:hypothetical protein
MFIPVMTTTLSLRLPASMLGLKRDIGISNMIIEFQGHMAPHHRSFEHLLIDNIGGVRMVANGQWVYPPAATPHFKCLLKLSRAELRPLSYLGSGYQII